MTHIHTRHSFGVIPLIKGERGWEVLLIRQSRLGRTMWGFPKGTPHEGESATETALRETHEEIGRSDILLLPDFAHTESYVFTEADATEVHKQVTYFAGVVTSKEVRLQADEVEDCVWLPLSDALQHLTYEGARDALTSLTHRLSNGI